MWSQPSKSVSAALFVALAVATSAASAEPRRSAAVSRDAAARLEQVSSRAARARRVARAEGDERRERCLSRVLDGADVARQRLGERRALLHAARSSAPPARIRQLNAGVSAVEQEVDQHEVALRRCDARLLPPTTYELRVWRAQAQRRVTP